MKCFKVVLFSILAVFLLQALDQFLGVRFAEDVSPSMRTVHDWVVMMIGMVMYATIRDQSR